MYRLGLWRIFSHNVTPQTNRTTTAAAFSPSSVRHLPPPPLQEVQLQGLVQGHEVAVSGDPPERHVVLHRDADTTKAVLQTQQRVRRAPNVVVGKETGKTLA